VGGEIIAREIHIETLYSNARVIALESITIENIEGEGNNLIIDPHAIESYHQKMSDLEILIRDKNSRIQTQSKEFITRKLAFKEKFSRIDQIQERIRTKQKSGELPAKADMVRMQQYKIEAEALQKNLEQVKELEDSVQSAQEELDKLYEADLHAVIIHNGIYNGHNRVIFMDPKTRKETAISPEGKVTSISLYLEENEKKFLLKS
jgi:hypothetical protein